MRINLRELRLKNVNSQKFNFIYNAPDELLTGGLKFDGAVKVNGTVYSDDCGVSAEGTVKFTVVGECGRCLEKAAEKITAEFNEKFSKVKTDETYLYVNDSVDLTDLINDTILINLPLNLLCKKSCKGICGCGVNLNTENCKCKK